MKKIKNKNKKHQKNILKIIIPLIVLILFLSSFIAFYLSIGTSSYGNIYNYKDLKKILDDANVKYKELIPFGEGYYYYVHKIILPNNEVGYIYITKDKRFFSTLLLTKPSVNSSLKETLTIYSQIFPIVPKKFKEIEDNGVYKVYIVDPNEPYYQQWEKIYFLVDNETVWLPNQILITNLINNLVGKPLLPLKFLLLWFFLLLIFLYH